MAETDTVPDADEKKGLPRKLLAVGVVVLLALAAAGYFLFAPGGEDGAEPAEPPAPTYSEEGGETLVVDAGTTMSVGGEDRHYAMVTYSVRPAIDADVDAVQLEFARMRSQVQRALLTYDADMLLSPDGVDALERDVAAVAEEIWPDGEIVEVYIENLVVQ